ncbi:MAG: hypothetical protein ACLTDR_13595 [Adlercreutzia equolifaciens]
MRFGPNVVEHAPFSIPMIGNTATGYVIGLTPEGAAVCHRMFTEDVPEAEVAAVNADLPIHLRRGGFVVEGESADGVAVREGAEGVDEGALGKGVEDAERPEDAARPEGAEREENVEGAEDAGSAAAEGANMAAFDLACAVAVGVPARHPPLQLELHRLLLGGGCSQCTARPYAGRAAGHH